MDGESFCGFGVAGGETGTGDVLPPKAANRANLRLRIYNDISFTR